MGGTTAAMNKSAKEAGTEVEVTDRPAEDRAMNNLLDCLNNSNKTRCQGSNTRFLKKTFRKAVAASYFENFLSLTFYKL